MNGKINSEVGMCFSIQYRKMSRNICNPDVPKFTSFKVKTSLQYSNNSGRQWLFSPCPHKKNLTLALHANTFNKTLPILRY